MRIKSPDISPQKIAGFRIRDREAIHPLSHSRPRKSSPATSTSSVLRQRPLELSDLPAQLVGLGALDLPAQPLRAGGKELLAPPLSSVSEISCSRQSSAIDFCPRNEASTSSLFCCAVNFRYFRVSLNVLSTR